MLINRALGVQITRGKIIIQQVLNKPKQPHYAANLIVIYLTEKDICKFKGFFSPLYTENPMNFRAFSGICDVNYVRVLLIINHTIIISHKSSIYSIRVVFLD